MASISQSQAEDIAEVVAALSHNLDLGNSDNVDLIVRIVADLYEKARNS